MISWESDLRQMANVEFILPPDFHKGVAKTLKLYLVSLFVGNLLEEYDKY